ncbi:MAG: gluconokinase [Myxococcota bacterium]
MRVIVMGVSGSGKSTIGRLLAEALRVPFADGDDFHPPKNIEKMRSGVPLTEADRLPWLERLAEELTHSPGLVLACSALSAHSRRLLRSANAGFVFLDGEFGLIQARLQRRSGHFFDSNLLRTQFEALERPKHAMVVRIDRPPEAIVDEIIHRLAELPS